MRPLLILLAIAFVVLMVAFGRNPVQEAREERAKNRVTSGDPLVDAINEYNKSKGRNSMGGEGYRGNSRNMGGTYYPHGDRPAANNRTPAYQPTPATPQYQPPQNSYYPPPANAQPQSELVLPPSWDDTPVYRLSDGQPVRFSGARVFTVDEQGHAIPMPDGQYPMMGGAITMVVRGGYKMMTYE